MAKVKKPNRAAERNDVPLPRYDITTVFGLTEILGGMEATAREYDTPLDRVKEWAISGDIPPGWHLRIFGQVCALGKTIDPIVFVFREDDEAASALSRLMMAERALMMGDANV